MITMMLFLIPVVLLAFYCLMLSIIGIPIIRKTILTRHGKPYLIRWSIISTPFFTVKLHKLLMSDPADLHDHPWSYLSIILWGGYIEHREYAFKGLKEVSEDGRLLPIIAKTANWYPIGSILFRKAGTPHRLELPKNRRFSLSLVITSKKTRDWGFTTPNGWQSHTKAIMQY